MFLFPLSVNQLSIENSSRVVRNELLLLAELKEGTSEAVPEIYASCLNNEKVSFFRSEPNKPLQLTRPRNSEAKWLSISGVLVLRKTSKGVVTLAWKDENLYFIHVSPQNDFESNFELFEWNLKSEQLHIKSCKESETNSNEVLLIATNGYFVVIQTGFKTHKVKYEFQMPLAVETVNAHLLEDFVIVCSEKSLILTYSCVQKEVISKIPLPREKFYSFSVSLEHKFMAAVAGAYLVKTDFEVDFSKRTTKSEARLHFMEDGIKWGTVLLPFSVGTESFCIFDRKLFLWSSNEFAVLDMKTGQTMRSLQLMESQTVFSCPSIKAVILVEKQKLNILMHFDEVAVASNSNTSSKINNKLNNMDLVLEHKSAKQDITLLQKNLLTFFLSYWENIFTSKLDVSTSESEDYLESVTEICDCLCAIDFNASHPFLKVSITRLHQHVLRVFKALCEDRKSQTAAKKFILNGLTKCLTSLRVKFELRPSIQPSKLGANPKQATKEEISVKAPKRNMNLGATFVQKSACRQVVQMLISKESDAKIKKTLQKADLRPQKALVDILSRSFEPEFAKQMFQYLEENSKLAINLGSEVIDHIKKMMTNDLSQLHDEDGSMKFSFDALVKFSEESKRDLLCSIGASHLVSELDQLKFSLKYNQIDAAKNLISKCDFVASDIFEVVRNLSYDIRNEILEHVYVFTDFVFPTVEQTLEFYVYTEDNTRFLKADATELLKSFCKLAKIDGKLSSNALMALLPLVDVEKCDLSGFNWDVKNIIVYHKLGQNLRQEEFAQTVVDSKVLWMQKSTFQEPGLSDLAMLSYWDLMTEDQRKVFMPRCLEAAQSYETIKLMLGDEYPELITCSMYDLLENSIGVKTERLFLWQKTNERRRSVGLAGSFSELPSTYPNFEDVMDVSEFNHYLPSFEYFLMHGRPSFAFQIILLRWTSLKDKTRVQFRLHCVRNILDIACENAKNDVIVSSAVVLLMMMGELPLYLRMKIQLLNFLKNRHSARLLDGNNFDSDCVDLKIFERISGKVIDSYADSKRNMLGYGGSDFSDFFCNFLTDASFLFMFSPYLKFFPLTRLVKINNQDPFYYWADFLGFAQRFGLWIDDLMQLINDMEECPLKEHFLLCFENYSAYASILRGQRKSLAPSASKARRSLISKIKQNSGDDDGLSLGTRVLDTRKSIDYTIKEENTSSSSSTDGSKPTAHFQSLSSILWLVKKDSDVKVLKSIARCEKPFLTAAVFGASEVIPVEPFMHYFLSSCGFPLSSSGHQQASVLNKVPLETLVLGNEIATFARQDVEPLEAEHFTDGLLQSLKAIPNMEKYSEFFENFIESFYLGAGAALDDANDKTFVDQLFEACVKSFDNFECQKHCVLMFAGLQENLTYYGLANLYMTIYDLKLPFYWPLDMRQNFPNVGQVELHVKKLVSELIARDCIEKAVNVIKAGLNEGLNLQRMLIDLQFMPIKSDIVKSESMRRTKQYLLEATLSKKLVNFGLSETEMVQAVSKEENLSIGDLSSILNIGLTEIDNDELKIAKNRIYNTLLNKIYSDLKPETSQNILEELKLHMTRGDYSEGDWNDERVRNYLNLQKELVSDQTLANFITELMKSGFTNMAVDLCLNFSKPMRIITFVLTSRLLLESKIRIIDFRRYVEMPSSVPFNPKLNARDVIFSACDKHFGFFRPAVENSIGKTCWGEALKLHENDVGKTLAAHIRDRDVAFLKLVSKLLACNIEKEVLIVIQEHYNRFTGFDASIDEIISILPNKNLLMDQLCRVAFDLLKDELRPFSAINLLGHALHCLGKSYSFHEIQKFDTILIKMIEVMQVSYDYKVTIHCLKVLGSEDFVASKMINLISSKGSMVDFVEQNKPLAQKFKKFLVPVLMSRSEYFQCLKDLNFNPEYAEVLVGQAETRLSNQFSVNLNSKEARDILKTCSKEFYEAYRFYEQDKRFAESSSALKYAKLCILQLQHLNEMLQIVSLENQPDTVFLSIAATFHLVGHILTFFDAYGKTQTLFPQIVCERVLFAGDFTFYEALHEYMDISPSFLKAAQVVAKQKIKGFAGKGNEKELIKLVKENFKEMRKRNPNRQYLTQALKSGLFA